MSIVSGFTKAEQNLNYYITQDTMFASALSNASGSPDFKYVFDVYANGNQLTRVKLYPDPVTAYGYFDAGPSVRNEIDYGWMIPYTDDPSYHDNIFITEDKKLKSCNTNTYPFVLHALCNANIDNILIELGYKNYQSNTTFTYLVKKALYHLKVIFRILFNFE